MTRIRREVLALPAARLGPDNPLPPLRPLDEVHRIDHREREEMPRDMARQLGYEPLHSLLPVRIRDGYGRTRRARALDALVIENDRLRATVLPGLGGRIVSLFHLPTRRELLYRNPVFQPANFALNGAWYSGGIEWNIGATGHTTLSCAPLHAARVPAPDGGEMLRLWEWERLRDLPFQVDLWLPEGSDFLYVGVRVRNPHERPAPAYWWSNIAVPEDRRVLAPAEEAWHFGYERRLRRVPVPSYDGLDRTYPMNSPYAADYFYEVPDGRRRWIAAQDADGHGLVQTSTDVLRGRKLFVWGSGPGGRRWQEWLTEPGTGGYCEIQAGLARTQLEHVRLEAESEVSWLEAYGPLAAPPGGPWERAVREAEERLEAALPRARVEEAYAAWRPGADTEPGETLAVGSGWGALEVLCHGWKLPGTPFAESTLGEAQAPWRELLRTGSLPEPDRAAPPGDTLVAPHWRDMLETARVTPHTEYHLGVAQWHAGDRAQAVRSWERGLVRASSPWPLLRCLAVADQETDHHERAAERYAAAFDDLCRTLPRRLDDVSDPRVTDGGEIEGDGSGHAGDGSGNGDRNDRGGDRNGGGGDWSGGEGDRNDRAGDWNDRGGERSGGGGRNDGGGLNEGGGEEEAWVAAVAALGREALDALLRVRDTARARSVWDRLPGAVRRRGRFRLLEAELLLAEGRAARARAVFDEGFEVADLREGADVIGRLWARLGEGPLPARYDFRMRPDPA